MKNLFKTEQSGRSMVEMLGVLAIVGVLSVGGIAGYSKALAKYKTSQTLDQISMLVANIRTTFSSATSYKDLNTENARAWGIASSDMYGTGANDLINPFLGKVEVGPATANGIANMGFAVMYSGLSRDACVSLATAGWGEGFSGVSDEELACWYDRRSGRSVPSGNGRAVPAESKGVGSFPAFGLCAASSVVRLAVYEGWLLFSAADGGGGSSGADRER